MFGRFARQAQRIARSGAFPSSRNLALAATGVVCVGLAAHKSNLSWSDALALLPRTSIAASEAKPAKIAGAAELAKRVEGMYGEKVNPRKIYDAIVQHVAFGGEESAELLWRLARACHDLAAELSDVAAKKSLTEEGLVAARRALALDSKNFACHKWYAIMLSDMGEFEGTKAKLQNAFVMRDHFAMAILLNPTDPTSHHLLGLWCFAFAELAWYERKIAAAVFATPPEATYEEALACFLEAERLDPKFYAKNSLMLGKTYLRMGRRDEAKRFLDECLSLPANNADDRAAHAEAQQLRSKC